MWIQTYGGTGMERATSLVATSDGGYAIAGHTLSFGVGEPDQWGNPIYSNRWLVKTDVDGNMMWSRTYGGMGADYACSLVVTSDGCYGIAGSTNSSGAGRFDCWLVKTDSHGNVVWDRTYGREGGEGANSLVATSDGGYAIAGETYSFGAGYSDFWLVKTDAYGNMEWNQTYGGTSYDWCNSLVTTSDGGYALAGYTESFGGGGRNFWLVKTDAYGNMEWNQTYGGPDYDEAEAVVATSDGGYAIAGQTYSFGAGHSDFLLVKTDAYGNVEWNQTYGGPGEEPAYSLVETSDGGYAIAGRTSSFGAGSYDIWLVKTDEFGYVEWNQTYGGTESEDGQFVVETSDGGYAIAGRTYSFGVGCGDFLLIKTDGLGVIPEYSSWLFPSLLLTGILVIVVYEKKLFKSSS